MQRNKMNQEEQKEYEERMGSPEMEYIQYLMETPELLSTNTEE